MDELARRLPLTQGRKVYGYLPPRIKAIINEIVDELAKDERVAEAYEIWQELQEQKCLDYNKQLPERVPLSQQKEFKMVRNMVVREALKLSEQFAPPTPDQNEETEEAPTQENSASAFSDLEESVIEQHTQEAEEQPEASVDEPNDDTPAREPEHDTAAPPPTAPLSKPSPYRVSPLSEAVVRMLHHMGNIFGMPLCGTAPTVGFKSTASGGRSCGSCAARWVIPRMTTRTRRSIMSTIRRPCGKGKRMVPQNDTILLCLLQQLPIVPLGVDYAGNGDPLLILIHPIEHEVISHQQLSVLMLQRANGEIDGLRIRKAHKALGGLDQF